MPKSDRRKHTANQKKAWGMAPGFWYTRHLTLKLTGLVTQNGEIFGLP
jgi:hypothetical protein